MNTESARSCTSLDHVYPSRRFGTRCYCGARAWGSKKVAEPTTETVSRAFRIVERADQDADHDLFQHAVEGLDTAVDALVQDASEKNSSHDEKDLALPSAFDVGSQLDTETDRPVSPTGEQHMSVTLTFTKLSKSGKYALYKGFRTITRLSVTDFPNDTPVPSFTAEGSFAGPREPKPVLTKEERAATRKAAPKLTLAQKIEKSRLAYEKLQAKAAAEQGVAV